MNSSAGQVPRSRSQRFTAPSPALYDGGTRWMKPCHWLTRKPRKRAPTVTFFSGSFRFSRVGAMPVPLANRVAVELIIWVRPIALAYDSSVGVNALSSRTMPWMSATGAPFLSAWVFSRS